MELKEEDKSKTAFQVGSLGFHECNKMPFDLSGDFSETDGKIHG